jgi:hypothetical protein
MTTKKTVKLNPTWKFAARIHLECIKHGSSEEAKRTAEEEIIKMAELLDKFVEEATSEREAKVPAMRD